MAEAVLEAQAEEAKALVAEAPVPMLPQKTRRMLRRLFQKRLLLMRLWWLRPASPLKKSWTMGTAVLTVVLGKLRWPT
jgi:hypothetical protein